MRYKHSPWLPISRPRCLHRDRARGLRQPCNRPPHLPRSHRDDHRRSWAPRSPRCRPASIPGAPTRTAVSGRRPVGAYTPLSGPQTKRPTGPLRHPKPLTPSDLHSMLEQEQEAMVVHHPIHPLDSPLTLPRSTGSRASSPSCASKPPPSHQPPRPPPPPPSTTPSNTSPTQQPTRPPPAATAPPPA